MSSILEKIRVWATTGTAEKPPNSVIDSGWVGGKQPESEYENERMQTRDKLLNGLIDNANTGAANASKAFNNLAAGNLKEIAFPHSPDNSFDLGNGFCWDACLYNFEGLSMVCSIHQPNPSTGYVIKCTNADTGELVVTHSLSSNFNTYFGIACDGQWLYILADEADASQRRIQVLAIDGLTGAAKPSFGYNQPGIVNEVDRDVRPIIKVLQSGNIFVAGRWDFASDAKMMTINAETGAQILVGNGGLPTDLYPSGDCVESDGKIYFTCKSKTLTTQWLGGVLESDLSLVATSTTTLPLNLGVQVSGANAGLVSLGEIFGLFVQLASGSEYPELQFYYGSDFNVDNPFGNKLYWSGEGTHFGPMTFDGHNLWLSVWAEQSGEGLSYYLALIKYNTAQMHTEELPADEDLVSAEPGNVYVVKPTTDTATAIGSEIGIQRPPLVFDGASVWHSPWGSTGGADSSQWFRVLDSFLK